MKRILLIAFVFVAASLSAQRSQEIGFFLGGSYYIGDLNPTGHFNSLTRPAAGLSYRYNFNNRFNLRGSLFFGNLAADDSRAESYQQQIRNLNFKSKLYELSAMAEFNFLEYEIGNDKHMFTPFMFLGVAGFNFNPRTYIGTYQVALQPLKTEGQAKPYKLYQISVPFGAGLKTSLAKNIGLVIEWGLRKTFTDYLDDVSTVYASPAELSSSGQLAVVVANRSTTGLGPGSQRGNPRTKDWYSFAGITLSFKLKEKPKQCSSYKY